MVNLIDWRSAATGAAQHQLGLYHAWRRSGYRVIMLAPRCSAVDNGASHLMDALVPTPSAIRMGMPPSLDTLFQLPFLLWARWKYGRCIVFTRMNMLTSLLVAVGRVLGMAMVVDHNAWLAKERLQSGGSRHLARFEQWSQVRAAKWASASRCVTHGLAEELARLGVARDRLHTIGNGSDTEHFFPVDKAAVRARFGLAVDRQYIGFIGNIVPWHGVDVAIAAFAQVATRHPHLDFVIFGGGSIVGDLEDQARRLGVGDRVHFMGPVPLDRANEAVNCFDLGVLPLTRKRDTAFGYSPVKIRDYAAAGRAVLTGRVPDNTLLEGQGWLFTHEPDDAADMARELNRLFCATDALTEAGLIARAYAVAQFGWHAVGSRIEAIFRTLPVARHTSERV